MFLDRQQLFSWQLQRTSPSLLSYARSSRCSYVSAVSPRGGGIAGPRKVGRGGPGEVLAIASSLWPVLDSSTSLRRMLLHLTFWFLFILVSSTKTLAGGGRENLRLQVHGRQISTKQKPLLFTLRTNSPTNHEDLPACYPLCPRRLLVGLCAQQGPPG